MSLTYALVVRAFLYGSVALAHAHNPAVAALYGALALVEAASWWRRHRSSTLPAQPTRGSGSEVAKVPQPPPQFLLEKPPGDGVSA